MSENTKIIKMEPRKVYFISYGNTTLVGRFLHEETCNYFFTAYIHNWNGYEKFHKAPYCVKSGIEEIRRDSHPEIQSLIRQEIEYGTI